MCVCVCVKNFTVSATETTHIAVSVTLIAGHVASLCFSIQCSVQNFTKKFIFPVVVVVAVLVCYAQSIGCGDVNAQGYREYFIIMVIITSR